MLVFERLLQSLDVVQKLQEEIVFVVARNSKVPRIDHSQVRTGPFVLVGAVLLQEDV